MSFNDYIYWQTLQETGKTPEEIYEYNHPEVVRCKECKHWHSKDNLTYCDRIDYGYGYKADDFCSYGERREP